VGRPDRHKSCIAQICQKEENAVAAFSELFRAMILRKNGKLNFNLATFHLKKLLIIQSIRFKKLLFSTGNMASVNPDNEGFR
jgi:hypothetical protein